MAILSNEWVLGGLIIGTIIAGGTIWQRTRGWFNGNNDKES